MTVSLAEPPLATVLDLCALKQTGITAYDRKNPTNPVFLSYSQLRESAAQKAALLRRFEPVVAGKIVLIHFQDHLDDIVWFWASVLAGYLPAFSTPLVNNSQGRKSHFEHLHRLLLNPLVITRRELLNTDFAENTHLRTVAVEAIEAPEIGGESNASFVNEHANGYANGHASSSSQSAALSTEGVAVLMLTSGSTGNAKAVCLTPKQIYAAVKGKLHTLPCPQGSAFLNWIGLDHVAGLLEIHLCAMYAGLDQVHVAATELIRNPVLFLRLLSDHRVSRTFAPNFFLCQLQAALDAASPEDLRGIDLSHLLCITSGGEPNLVSVCAALEQHFGRLRASVKSVITPGFGMTETCAGSIYHLDCPELDLRAGSEFAALGKCVPGIEMRISPVRLVESDGAELKLPPAGQGALEVRGPLVFERYFNNPRATLDAFTDDGWFRTGDMATFDPDGNLKLVGRSKDVININGVKYLPHEIETAIGQAGIAGVAQLYIVCFAHRPCDARTERIYVVYQHNFHEGDTEGRLETLNAIVRTVALFTGARPQVLPLAPGRLDKTTLGKISRAKVRDSLEQGLFKDQEDTNTRMLQSYRASHYAEPRDEVERALMTTFDDTLGLGNLDMGIDTPVLDTGVTSIDLIRLKGACESRFGIADMPIITLMTTTTIRSLASAVKELRRARYQSEYSPTVTLQPNGTESPLWLVHPGVGEVLVFIGLVQYFPDRPIYALRARGFNPGEEPFNSLAEMVAMYCQAVKKQQAQGPYAIAGYSYGSMIAFEIAKVLEADGQTVKFVGSFNLPPHIKSRMRQLDWTSGLLHLAQFCGLIPEQRFDQLLEMLRALPQPEQVARLLEECDQDRRAQLTLTQASLLTWAHVSWSLQKIGQDYEPSGSVSHMDVFYCQPLKMVSSTREEYLNTKLKHWADFVRDDARFHEVDGEHYTMIGPDHVATFQQTLKKALAARGV